MGPTNQQMGGVSADGNESGGIFSGAGGTGNGGAVMAGSDAGATSGGAGMVSGGTDDVIIASAPDGPKASRKLILGIILGVLVLIGGAVVAVVLLNQGETATNDSGTQVVVQVDGTNIIAADDYKESFLLYANYILSGVASTEALPEEFDNSKDYAIWQAFDNNNEEFLKIASVYLDNFKSQYEVIIDPNADSGIFIADEDNVIDDYFANFNFVQKYYNKELGLSEMSDEEKGQILYELVYSEDMVVVDVWDVWGVLNG